MNGYTGKILEIDMTYLTSKTIPTYKDACDKFLGGKGLGAWLLAKYTPINTDPLSAENVLILLSGPLTGTFAPATRGCVVSKSPLTNIYCDSYAGGYFFQEMKYCGYDAIIIMGRAQTPVYIVIEDEKVSFQPADELLGLDTYDTNTRLKEILKDDRFLISCIGPAGENLVKYALIDFEPHRQAGRGGLGAVMGSKKLKALALKGSGGVNVADLPKFSDTVKRAWGELKASSDTQLLAEFGTPALGDTSNLLGFFPVKNFEDGVYQHVDKINGDAQDAGFNLRDIGCFACPIHCTKVGKIRKGKYTGVVGDTTEYETIGLLGGNIEVKTLEGISYLNNLCDRLGLDSISTGNVLGFLADAFEKGIAPLEYINDTVKFGDVDTFGILTKKIAARDGIGDLLAEGVKIVSEKWGAAAESIAVHVKGLELPAWGPRGSAGMGLAYMTGDRGGCHQRGYPIAYEQGAPTPYPVDKPLLPLSTEGKGKILAWDQNYIAAVYSMVFCDFTRTGMQPETYAKLLSSALGKDLSKSDLFIIGERVWNLIRLYNIREGLTCSEDKLPIKLKNPLPSGPYAGHAFSEEDQKTMLQDYYVARGWDKNGLPTPEKLNELGIDKACVTPF
jgi:aldehyde:ferredoxin oxidoreductase